MTENEVREVLRSFTLMQPAYKAWQNRTAQDMAGSGGDAAKEWEAIRSSMSRTLSTVDFDEGMAVISRMEQGRLPVPPYGELPLMILREAKIGRQSSANTYEVNRSYQCLRCLDSGVTNVWNPEFVESYREEFKAVSRSPAARRSTALVIPGEPRRMVFFIDKYDPDGLVDAWVYNPADWESEARQWWLKRTNGDGGPMHHVALCCCSCPAQTRMKSELDEFNRGTRKGKRGELVGAPACGVARYNLKTMMLKTSDSFADLSSWYATNEPAVTQDWS